MAAATELDTFVTKFKQLWQSGLGAHLDLDTYAGQAWVGLRLRLGDAPGPHHPHVHIHHVKTRNGPSRERRRDRRAASRLKEAVEASKLSNVAEEATDNLIEVENSNESVDLAAKATIDHSENDEETIEYTAEVFDTAEEATNGFFCELCDLKFTCLRGLRTHEGRMHKSTGSPIPQLDGESDDNVIYTFVSDYHREDIEYTLEEIFTKEIEVNLVSDEKCGGNWTADRLWTVIVKLPGHKIFAWPEMSRDQDVVFRNITMQKFPLFPD